MESDKKGQEVRKTKLTLTPRECELVTAAWCSAQNPQIDWDKFAEIAGFKNAHSARTCFGPLKKRLHEQYGNGKKDGVVKSYEWKPRQKKASRKQDEEKDAEAGPASKRNKTTKPGPVGDSATEETSASVEEGLV